MDPRNDEDKVNECGASSKDTPTVSKPIQEINGSSNTIGNRNQEMTSDTETESDTISFDSSRNSNLEETTSSSQSTTLECEPLPDCRISIPENVQLHPNPNSVIGLRSPESCKDSLLNPEDSVPLYDQSTRYVADHCVGDVTLNLTEFLSYAQRNNYDIVIPTARENPAASTNSPRMGSGRGFMVLEQQNFPRDFSVATSTVQYPPTDYISSVTSRNSVLAPNMFHPGEGIQPPVVDFSAPPPYEINLPTYEEVQREKALEDELVSPNMDLPLPNADASSSRTLSFLTIDSETNADPGLQLLGNDCMFVISFFLALAMNWIGFLLLLCFCHTIASRYGALCGFGLSLVKWSFMVKHSPEMYFDNTWVLCFLTVLGLILGVKALVTYIYVKSVWHNISQAARERYLLLY